MTSQAPLNCKKLHDLFEGREAIYIERGLIRVRVTNIRCDAGARLIEAEVEEIPTAGLPVGLERSLFHGRQPNEPPLRWEIGSGYLSEFSEHTWRMGYGGWQLYFEPEVVSGLTSLASNWPVELDAVKRYEQALRFVMHRGADKP